MSEEVKADIKLLAARANLTAGVLRGKLQQAGGVEKLDAKIKPAYGSFARNVNDTLAWIRKETGRDPSTLGTVTQIVLKSVWIKDIESWNDKLDEGFRTLAAATRAYDTQEVIELKLPETAPTVHESDETVYERVRQLSTRCAQTMAAINEKLKHRKASEHEELDKLVAQFESLISEIAGYLHKISGEKSGTLGRFKHVVLSSDIKEKLSEYDERLNQLSMIWNLEVANWWDTKTVTAVATSTTGAVVGGVTGAATTVAGGVTSAVSTVVGGVTGAVTSVVGGVTSVGKAVVGGVTTATTTTASVLSTPFTATWNYFSELSGTPTPVKGPAVPAKTGAPAAVQSKAAPAKGA